MVDLSVTSTQLVGASNGQARDDGLFTFDANPVLSAALCYHAVGWSVFPLCPADHYGPMLPKHSRRCVKPGKQPVVDWKPYQVELATVEQLREWWAHNPNYNVAVAMG